MSLRLRDKVQLEMNSGELRGFKALLMWHLADHLNDIPGHQKYGECFPSIGTLARKVGCNRSTIKRMFDECKKDQWISIEPRKDHKTQQWDRHLYYLKKYAKRDKNGLWSNGVQTWTENAKGIPKRVKANQTPTHPMHPPYVPDAPRVGANSTKGVGASRAPNPLNVNPINQSSREHPHNVDVPRTSSVGSPKGRSTADRDVFERDGERGNRKGAKEDHHSLDDDENGDGEEEAAATPQKKLGPSSPPSSQRPTPAPRRAHPEPPKESEMTGIVSLVRHKTDSKGDVWLAKFAGAGRIDRKTLWTRETAVGTWIEKHHREGKITVTCIQPNARDKPNSYQLTNARPGPLEEE
jgi:hypothetical protein